MQTIEPDLHEKGLPIRCRYCEVFKAEDSCNCNRCQCVRSSGFCNAYHRDAYAEEMKSMIHCLAGSHARD